MPDQDRIACRTPANPAAATRIPRWKHDLLRGHILELVREAGPEGLLFSGLADKVAARLSDGERARLGSVSWHATTVKLEMEVAGELTRLPGPGPQRLVSGRR